MAALGFPSETVTNMSADSDVEYVAIAVQDLLYCG